MAGEPNPPGVEVVIMAAVASNGVIGADGNLPWHYPEDLRHFKETTLGHPVILGRRTYESIVDRLGEPLPGRTSIVLTTRKPELPEGAVRAGSVESALALARERDDVTFVAGGASVYEQFLPRADRLLLTEIYEEHVGDTYFPKWNPDEWCEIAREERDDLAFVEYERR